MNFELLRLGTQCNMTDDQLNEFELLSSIVGEYGDGELSVFYTFYMDDDDFGDAFVGSCDWYDIFDVMNSFELYDNLKFVNTRTGELFWFEPDGSLTGEMDYQRWSLSQFDDGECTVLFSCNIECVDDDDVFFLNLGTIPSESMNDVASNPIFNNCLIGAPDALYACKSGELVRVE